MMINRQPPVDSTAPPLAVKSRPVVSTEPAPRVAAAKDRAEVGLAADQARAPQRDEPEPVTGRARSGAERGVETLRTEQAESPVRTANTPSNPQKGSINLIA